MNQQHDELQFRTMPRIGTLASMFRTSNDITFS